jgi:hypothetical protein
VADQLLAVQRTVQILTIQQSQVQPPITVQDLRQALSSEIQIGMIVEVTPIIIRTGQQRQTIIKMDMIVNQITIGHRIINQLLLLGQQRRTIMTLMIIMDKKMEILQV